MTPDAAVPPTGGHTTAETSPYEPTGARAAVERALRLVVLVWSGAWLALMGHFAATGGSAPLTTVMLIGLVVGWVVVIAARLPVNGWYVAALAVTATVQAAIAEPLELWADGLTVTWTNLAALCAGFLVAGARGRLVVVGIAGAQLVVLGARAASDGAVASIWPGVIAAAAAYALVDGMAAHVGSSALRSQGDATDRAADQLALGRRDVAARDAGLRETERVSRVLHDTVLNTLGAVRRGVEPGDVPDVRARCADDLAELRGLRDRRFDVTGDTGIRPDTLLRALEARAAVLSLAVEVRSRVTTTAAIPTAVGDAVSGACAEALLNVSKHSGTRVATLDLAWDGTSLDVSVNDEGRGWSGELPVGRGIARSILARASEAGVDALVATAPGQGTTLTLGWRAAPAGAGSTVDRGSGAALDATASGSPPTPGPDAGTGSDAAAAPPADVDRAPTTYADAEVARTLARAAVLAGGWVTGLMAFLTVVFWGSPASGSSLVALAILGAVLALSWQAGVRRGRVPISAPHALLLVVAAFLVPALMARSVDTCAQLADAWWGLDGGIAVVLSLVLLTRGWWWSAAGAAAVVAGALSLQLRSTPIVGDCSENQIVTVALEVSIVVAVVVFREAVLRLWRRAVDTRARVDRLRIAADVSEATERARDARLDAVLAATVPLLDTLARGQVDPTETVVRRQCATAEAALRALLTIGPAHDWLGDLLGDAVLHAYVTGRRLQVMPSFATPVLPSESAAGPLRALLIDVVDRTPDGEALTAALTAGPEGCSLTLVSDCVFEPLPAATGRSLHREGLALDQVQTGTQSLVEVRWS